MKLLLAIFLLSAAIAQAQTTEDPLAPWRKNVQIRPATGDTNRHVVHSYFNTCPESPDGKSLLFFTSTTANAQLGEVRVMNRATGEEKVLAKDVNTEDAHRVACQQWVSNGRRVVYHGERAGVWTVAVVDVNTGKERILAKDRLSGWGQPDSDWVPLYGLHWGPGEHRDLELVNVVTGELKKALTNDEVKAKYGEWLTKTFADKPTSIFFPVMSPDMKRVFFKMASPAGGDARSSKASQREGLVCYDLEGKRFLFMRSQWGHPSWHPDGKTIVEKNSHLIDSNGKIVRVPGLPGFGGDHPTASPDGKLLVTDTTMDRFGGTGYEWGIALADARGTNHIIIDKFDNGKGARSWRVSHPHPYFSADGKRIYYNTSSGKWTQLRVAEIGGK